MQIIRNEIDSLTQSFKEFSLILSDDRLRYEDKINLIALKIALSPLIDYLLIYDENGKFLDMFKPITDLNIYLMLSVPSQDGDLVGVRI